MTDPPYGEVSGPLRIARLLTFLPRWQPALRAETARTGTWPHGTPSHFTAHPATSHRESDSMSNWRVEGSPSQPPTRRVRDEVRDGVAVVLTSAVASTMVALIATLLMKLAG